MPAAEMKSVRVKVRGEVGSVSSDGHAPGMGGRGS